MTVKEAAMNAMAAKDAAQPPLIQIAGRLNGSLQTLEERLSEVISAGQRLADRLGGDSPVSAATRGAIDMGPPTGWSGQIGEIEAVVLRAEAMINDMTSRAESMINRLTPLA